MNPSAWYRSNRPDIRNVGYFRAPRSGGLPRPVGAAFAGAVAFAVFGGAFAELAAQIEGGDYSDEAEKKPAAVVAELGLILKKLQIRGFRPMKTDVREAPETEQAALAAGAILVNLLKDLPTGYYVEVTGHADKVGHDTRAPTGEGLNDWLSRLRAESVTAFLIARYKLSPHRFKSGGAGDHDNDRKVTFRIRKAP